jgi:Right handed beta helix region
LGRLSRFDPRLKQGLAAAVLVACLGAPAPAVAVECGATIVRDTTLHRDLRGCAGNGLEVRADGVTLDLAGHTIAGRGEAGVLLGRHDGVTVRGGAVRGFDSGIIVSMARDVRVLHMRTSGSALFGMVVVMSRDVAIRNSSAGHTQQPEGDGLGIFGSHGVRVLRSAFRSNAQLGIHIGDSAGTLIKRSLIAGNRDFGVLIEGDRNELRRVRCHDNGACVNIATGERNAVLRSRSADDGVGLSVEDADRNRIAHNRVLRPAQLGVYLALNSPPIGGSGNIVNDNRVLRSGGDGFAVRAEDESSRITGNVAIGAARDGFDIASVTAVLAGNRAVRNGDLGIEAAAGVIDAGANVAHDNRDARQCTAVSCG